MKSSHSEMLCMKFANKSEINLRIHYAQWNCVGRCLCIANEAKQLYLLDITIINYYTFPEFVFSILDQFMNEICKLRIIDVICLMSSFCL